MKLKSIPEDFVVDELNRRQPGGGPYALYQLSKRSIGTLEAIGQICRKWNLPQRQVNQAGLKDRHALTTQSISIRGGPRQNCESTLWNLKYLGQTNSAIAADDIIGNRFSIVVRSLSQQQANSAVENLKTLTHEGFPNYFDEQRFGSLTSSGRFVAERWCKKDYESALWLALAEFSAFDDKDDRQSRGILRQHWGNWVKAKALLPKSHRRSIVTYLCDHPTKFRKAFALVDPALRGLYLSAFQSGLWNRMLSLAIEQDTNDSRVGGAQRSNGKTICVAGQHHPMPTRRPTGVPERISLPSARKDSMDDASISLANRVLAPFCMTVGDLKISFPRDRWFSRVARDSWVVPRSLTATESDDDRNARRRQVTMSFELPKGCYATTVLKVAIPEEDS